MATLERIRQRSGLLIIIIGLAMAAFILTDLLGWLITALTTHGKHAYMQVPERRGAPAVPGPPAVPEQALRQPRVSRARGAGRAGHRK